MSNKIVEHKNRKEIEEIILRCKFGGLGSVKIHESIKSELGVSITRPTIDKHYKENMNGEFLTQQIEEKERVLVMAENGKSGGVIAPVIDLKELEAIRAKYKGKQGYMNKIEELRECMALLIESNFQAFIEGKERFKPEYSKYLKDLESIVKK